METIRSDHRGYDEVRRVFNGLIDKRPAVIARCDSAADVAEALALARRDGLEVAVRAGGHSVAGMSATDRGIVVDLRPMKEISIDPARRTARVGAGVTWAEFDAAAQEFGLATTGGRDSTTGVAGLTLGGGTGWLDRTHGFACDNLISVDLVTADGSEITASATQHPDLFWALHGGGGNFGVATSFEFRLHPVGPIVLAGVLLWPAADGPDVARRFRDVAAAAPDELGCALVFLTAPPAPFVPESLCGRPAVGIGICFVGPLDEGEAVVAPLRATAAADGVGPMPYATFQSMLDYPEGLLHYWSAEYHDELSDQALDTFVTHGLSITSPLSMAALIRWGGAVARVEDSPLPRRSAGWVSHPFAVWDDLATNDVHIAWARRFADAMKPFGTGATYLNFVGDEGEERVRAAYGAENYRRLAEIKAKYDPDNVFRLNHNITPAGSPA